MTYEISLGKGKLGGGAKAPPPGKPDTSDDSGESVEELAAEEFAEALGIDKSPKDVLRAVRALLKAIED